MIFDDVHTETTYVPDFTETTYVPDFTGTTYVPDFTGTTFILTVSHAAEKLVQLLAKGRYISK